MHLSTLTSAEILLFLASLYAETYTFHIKYCIFMYIDWFTYVFVCILCIDFFLHLFVYSCVHACEQLSGDCFLLPKCALLGLNSESGRVLLPMELSCYSLEIFFCLIFKTFSIILKLYLSPFFLSQNCPMHPSPISIQIHVLFFSIIEYIFVYLHACIFTIITCSIHIFLLLCVFHIEGMTFWNWTTIWHSPPQRWPPLDLQAFLWCL